MWVAFGKIGHIFKNKNLRVTQRAMDRGRCWKSVPAVRQKLPPEARSTHFPEGGSPGDVVKLQEDLQLRWADDIVT